MVFQCEFDFSGGSGIKPASTPATVTMDGILAAVADPGYFCPTPRKGLIGSEGC
jgi:hypothetical protein